MSHELHQGIPSQNLTVQRIACPPVVPPASCAMQHSMPVPMLRLAMMTRASALQVRFPRLGFPEMMLSGQKDKVVVLNPTKKIGPADRPWNRRTIGHDMADEVTCKQSAILSFDVLRQRKHSSDSWEEKGATSFHYLVPKRSILILESCGYHFISS